MGPSVAGRQGYTVHDPRHGSATLGAADKEKSDARKCEDVLKTLSRETEALEKRLAVAQSARRGIGDRALTGDEEAAIGGLAARHGRA